MAEKNCKFQDILVRSNSKIRDDRAKRITASAVDGVKLQLINKAAAVRKIEDELDNMLDLSSTPSLRNDARVTDFNGADFTSKLVDLRLQLMLAQQEYDETTKVAEEYFNVAV